MKLLKETYLTSRFFIYFSISVLIMVMGFVWAPLIYVSFASLIFGVFLIIVDLTLLYQQEKPVECQRKVAEILSLGDENPVQLKLKVNASSLKYFTLIDELPEALQVRDFKMEGEFDEDEINLNYKVTPKTRGEYNFGHAHVFIRTALSFISRRLACAAPTACKVFPSVIQLKKYEIISLSSSNAAGLKNIRRLGHSYEFDQIKNYVFGDDSRSINWKASGRKGVLMVNQYEDERSQQIISIIDNSRLMQIPFNGMSMLDHAINASLVLSNIVLKKHDKMGLITFAKRINTFLLPNNGARQLNKIYHSLYNEETSPFEANYEQLHYAIKTTLTNRSLIFLFTNFSTMENLTEILPILRRLNRNHLLVVVFFDDVELQEAATREADDVFGVYEQTIMKKLIQEKSQMVKELGKHGILSLKTNAEDLSINTINKYFELKRRGLV